MYYINKQQSDRIRFIKVICTFMVIFIHANSSTVAISDNRALSDFSNCFQVLRFIISECFSRIAVPCFFLISSILLHSKPFTWTNNIKKKIKNLLVPYFIFISLYIIIFFVAQSIPFTAIYFSNPDNIIRNWGVLEWVDAYIGKISRNVPFNVALWFVRDLFILNILSIPIKRVVNKFPKIVFLLILVVWIYNCPTPVVDNQAIVFWVLGILIVKYNYKTNLIDNCKWIIITIPALILLLLDCKYKITMIHQISIILYMIIVVKASKYLTTGKVGNRILSLSKYNFFIYAFHLIVLITFIKFCRHYIPQYSFVEFLEYVASPFITVLICIIIAKIIIKLTPDLYNLITGSRL